MQLISLGSRLLCASASFIPVPATITSYELSDSSDNLQRFIVEIPTETPKRRDHILNYLLKLALFYIETHNYLNN